MSVSKEFQPMTDMRYFPCVTFTLQNTRKKKNS